MSTITVSAAAAELGVTPGRIRQLCQQHGIGQMLTPRLRVLTRGDIATLRRYVGRPVGRPPGKR